MTAKRHAAAKDPLPPPSPDEDSDDEGSSEEEEEPQGAQKQVSKAPATSPKKITKGREQEEEDGEEEEEDDEGTNSSSESDDDEDDGKKKPAQPQPQAQPKQKQLPAEDSSSSDEEGSSESGEEDKPVSGRRHPRGPDPSIKPISSKPMDETPISKQKKAAASASAPDKKKQQTKKEGDASVELDTAGKKRNLFERFWKEGDEVKILQGIVDYHSRKGTDPSSAPNIDALHESMKTTLKSPEFSKSQLADKIRRLKKKYETNASRAKGGAEPSFTKPYELEAYELSKRLWGPKKRSTGNIVAESENLGDADADEAEPESQEDHVAAPKAKKQRGAASNSTQLANGKHDSVVDDSEPSFEFLKEAIAEIGNDAISSLAAKTGLKSVDPVKAKVIDDKFRKLRMAEMKLHIQYLDLMAETVKLVLDGVSKSG